MSHDASATLFLWSWLKSGQVSAELAEVYQPGGLSFFLLVYLQKALMLDYFLCGVWVQ